MNDIFTNLDVFCIGLIALLSFTGFIRGFLKEFASIVNWSATVILTISLKQFIIETFLKDFKFPFFKDFLANVILFILFMLIISMITKVLVEKTRQFIPYSTNSSLGFLFGFLKGILIVGSCLACFDLISNGNSPMTEKSVINNMLIKQNDMFSNVFRELLGEYFLSAETVKESQENIKMLQQMQEVNKMFNDETKNNDIEKEVNNLINQRLNENIEEIQNKNEQTQESLDNNINNNININDVLDNILENSND